MKTILQCAVAFLLFLTLNFPVASARAQGSAFTYQGSLNSGGSPANGLFDFRFRLDADPAGNVILNTVLTNSIGVTNGLFTTTIDFGTGWFNGSNYWLEVGVKTNNFANFTVLNPLQQLTPAPYAIMANSASNLLGALPAAQLSGAIANNNLPANPNFSGTVTAGFFSGNGASLTSLNASNLSNGTVPLAQLPGAVVTNSQNGLILGGTFIGNGSGLTNIYAANLLTDDNQNVFVGSGNVTGGNGFENTAIGYQALFSNNRGYFNTAVGSMALYSNTGTNDFSKGNNTAVGYQALFSNTTGDGNTANGGDALSFNLSGKYNTAIGTEALNQLGAFNGAAGGTNNIALGYLAGYNLTGNESSNIDIGNLGVAGENKTIRIGTPGIQTQTYLAGVVNGNGNGLTNLNAAQVTGSFTNGFVINGSQSGGIGSPLALIQNNNTSGSTAPALRTVGYGNSLNGVLSVSSQGTGLIAQFGNAFAFVADITTNGTAEVGGLRVGGTGTTLSVLQAGQSQMPGGSTTAQTNFTIIFPQAFSSVPKILVSVANDPSFPDVSDTFVTSVSSNSLTAFRVNIVRVDSASAWSQHLLINWQAWQ